MSNLPSYAYGILGVLLLCVVIARQVGERRMTAGKLIVMPILFLVLAFVQDHNFGHDLVASPLAIPLLILGIVVGAGAGIARAMTMSVRLEGAGTLVTKGGWKTIVSWVALIALRLGMIGLAALLGVHEGLGVTFVCAAATFGAQNLVLAYRSGLGSSLLPAR